MVLITLGEIEMRVMSLREARRENTRKKIPFLLDAAKVGTRRLVGID